VSFDTSNFLISVRSQPSPQYTRTKSRKGPWSETGRRGSFLFVHSMNVLASPMQMMLHGFALPACACRGTCHTLETDFRRGRRPFCYPNPGVTLRTFPSDRRHLRCRHVRDPMTDNADFSEFRNIQHWRQLLRRTLEPFQCRRQLFFPGVVKLRPFIKNVSKRKTLKIKQAPWDARCLHGALR
jgi:hypothetical protein